MKSVARRVDTHPTLLTQASVLSVTARVEPSSNCASRFPPPLILPLLLPTLNKPISKSIDKISPLRRQALHPASLVTGH